MTDKRNAQEDIEHVTFLGHPDFYGDHQAYDALYNISLYWIKHSEGQRIRAEAAEQERDKLLAIMEGVYGAALNDVNRWSGGAAVGLQVFQNLTVAKRLVRDLEPILFPDGADTDGQ